MSQRRFEDLRDTLNRTLNATISRSRLLVVRAESGSDRAVITHVVQGRRHVFSSGLLTNGLYLTVRFEVRLVNGLVTVERSSIAYRRSEGPTSSDWIFRYEYEPRQARSVDYRYPVAHLHLNATPPAYPGAKAFPELHLPTRRICLEEIVRHLIVEHDVPTLGPTDEALAFLDEQQAEFERNRTDPDAPVHDRSPY